MVSKTVLSFALVVTGTFSEFLAVINVVSFFGWGYRASKTALSFALIVKVPSTNTKRVLTSSSFLLD